MKRQSLITTLAMLLFAVAASAQSDPSVGGSFGTSFDHRAVSGGALSGTTNIGETTDIAAWHHAASTSGRIHSQPHRSFWDWLTGRNKSASSAAASHSARSHGWFHRPASASQKGARSQSSAHLQSQNRHADAAAKARHNSWLMPFFGRS